MGAVEGDAVAQAGRREERKARNREKILQAARRVFAEKDFGEATVRDIVRATDLASGTFYNYFRDKEAVFRALLEEFEARTRDATLHVRRDSNMPLEERIEVGARAFFQVVVEDAELFCVLRRNVGSLPMMPAEGLFGAGMAEFSEDLESWSADGELPDVDLDYLSAAIAGLAFQVANRLVERDPPDPDEAARFCSRFVLGAIGALAGEPAPG